MHQSIFLSFFIAVFIFLSCQRKQYIFIEGETMGTVYHIKYYHPKQTDFKPSIDSLLQQVNHSLSTYIPESVISKVNQSKDTAQTDEMFRKVFQFAKDVYQQSGGAFDPTVMLLVNAWGFGFKKMENVDSNLIDSLLKYVGFEKVTLKEDKLIKLYPAVMLDFSAIAKGFGVDVVAEFLEKNGVNNYMVEIGGEVRVKGLNPKGEKWNIAIEKPIDNQTAEQIIDTILSISDLSLATSGNYRNFYYKEGVKYAHTIDPKTGYPALNDLLSASVFAETCMEADAWATAFMVLGLKNSIELLKNKPEIAVFFIYRDENRKEKFYLSENFEKFISK